MVATEHAGHWTGAIRLPGPAGDADRVASVVCSSPGNCTADGGYGTTNNKDSIFVVSEVAGRWGQPHVVPGDIALNDNDQLGTSSLACHDCRATA